MKAIRPQLESTVHSEDHREWIPASFRSFIRELDQIVSSCDGEDPAPLFRGQSNHEWFLDCTFLRGAIQQVFNIPDHHLLKREVRRSSSFHRAMASLLLLKFGTVWKPSQELSVRARAGEADPWYELIKHLQQYPEKDYFVPGIFLVDWSLSRNIALYFATYEGKGSHRRISSGHGAVWILDSVATGDTLQTVALGEVLTRMRAEGYMEGNSTLPLLFHPPKQTLQPRSLNQVPIYVAQMDFRYDLAEIWANNEVHMNSRIFKKLILREDQKIDAAKYLDSKGITEKVLYPE